MHWKFWIALGGILISIGFAIGFTIAQLLYAQGAGMTISGIIVSIAPVAGAGVASLGLFQAWSKNRKEEERIPALEFDGFVKTKGTITLPPGPRSAFIVSSTYSVRVKKIKGKIGRAEQCDSFISLPKIIPFDIHSRWLPDYLVECDIGDSMNLVLFHTILEKHQSDTDYTEVIFLHTSTHDIDHDETIPLRLVNHQSQLLNIKIGSRNAETPRPLQKTIKQIMDEARTFS